jgi:hypothetical protein
VAETIRQTRRRRFRPARTEFRLTGTGVGTRGLLNGCRIEDVLRLGDVHAHIDVEGDGRQVDGLRRVRGAFERLKAGHTRQSARIWVGTKEMDAVYLGLRRVDVVFELSLDHG